MEPCGNTSRWDVVIGITLLGVFLSASAQAATFTVNNPLDVVDAAPGNGVCETAPGNGVCTLRAAIQETNALGGAQIILPPNIYRLDITNQLAITSNLTIAGDDASTTIIDGNKSARVNSGIFSIRAGVTVSISGVTIRNGAAGGILNNGGTLTLTNSIVSGNNTNSSGGGISNNGGTLMLTNSTVSGNSAKVDGAGIISSNGTLTVATVTLINSTVSGNNAGAATASSGGGIYNLGRTLTLINSTVSGNSVVCCAGGGGIYNAGVASTLTLINSTVSGNSTVCCGGGIQNYGTMMLTNSTVSGNSTTGDGGGIYNGYLANLFNATITNNQADADINGSGTGGGVFNSTGYTLTFQNTIIAENFEGLTRGDCAGTIVSRPRNLMEVINSSHCTIVGTVPILAPPKLDALQSNGGPTQTHALQAGSPAIDAGDSFGCRDQFGVLLTTDQRGFPRAVAGGKNDGLCDIGAYEFTRVGVEFNEVLSGALGQTSVLAAGVESSGASRGPAFQLFNTSGVLQTTQFALNPDFRIDLSFVLGNFDADAADEVLVGGRETTGLSARAGLSAL